MNKHKLVGLKGKRAFSCVKCDKPFAKNKELLQHKARMHRGLAFKCLGEDGSSVCGKYFKMQENMGQHMMVCGNSGTSSLQHRRLEELLQNGK